MIMLILQSIHSLTLPRGRCRLERLIMSPQKALRGGITVSFLEPLRRSWSHFVGIHRQKLTRSLKD